MGPHNLYTNGGHDYTHGGEKCNAIGGVEYGITIE